MVCLQRRVHHQRAEGLCRRPRGLDCARRWQLAAGERLQRHARHPGRARRSRDRDLHRLRPFLHRGRKPRRLRQRGPWRDVDLDRALVPAPTQSLGLRATGQRRFAECRARADQGVGQTSLPRVSADGQELFGSPFPIQGWYNRAANSEGRHTMRKRGFLVLALIVGGCNSSSRSKVSPGADAAAGGSGGKGTGGVTSAGSASGGGGSNTTGTQGSGGGLGSGGTSATGGSAGGGGAVGLGGSPGTGGVSSTGGAPGLINLVTSNRPRMNPPSMRPAASPLR